MTTKALRKQLAAAIAMVVVAGVALSSSTYAWFVSNNTVKATTSTISAQSNAPFLMIDKETISSASKTAIAYTEIASSALYPSEVVSSSGTPKFISAYAASASATTELENSRYDVGDAAAAVTGKFAVKEVFKIGAYDTKAGSFKDLKVAKVALDGTSGLDAALSVLIVGPDGWAVYKASDDGTVLEKYKDNTAVNSTATDGVLDAELESGAANAAKIEVYVFYDGSETNIFTNNLDNLTAIGCTVTFTATPVNTQGTAVTTTNAVDNANVPTKSTGN